MSESESIKLPSGAELRITLAPFADARALYQALLAEVRGVNVAGTEDVRNLLKEIFCAGFSSKLVEACVWKCIERATYNNLKIIEDTFEPAKAREDYFTVFYEVTRENVLPFTKSLYVQLKAIREKLPDILS